MKTFLVMKIVAAGSFGAFPPRIGVIFQADADFEVKSAIGTFATVSMFVEVTTLETGRRKSFSSFSTTDRRKFSR